MSEDGSMLMREVRCKYCRRYIIKLQDEDRCKECDIEFKKVAAKIYAKNLNGALKWPNNNK